MLSSLKYRRVLAGAAATAYFTVTNNNCNNNTSFQVHCDYSSRWPFDSQGFEHKYTPAIAMTPLPAPLYLVGVASMVKPGLLYDAEVAKISVSLSPKSLEAAKNWSKLQNINDKSSASSTLAQTLLNLDHTITKYSSRRNPELLEGYESYNYTINPLTIAVSLRFQSEVRTKDFLRFFHKSFENCSKESYEAFKETLLDVISNRKIHPKEEISFYWFSNGDIMISLNEEISAIIHIPEINVYLLDAFVTKEKTMIEDLVTCVEENIPYVEQF